MVKAKQPSKRQREYAARFCDMRAAAWCVYPVQSMPSPSRMAGERIARRVFSAMQKVPDRHIGMMARTWAEAAAWLRSGEELP